MHVTAFYEGDSVAYVGDALDGIEPATGTLMAFASSRAAHVKWLTGQRTGEIDIVDIYDLMPTASVASLVSPTITATSVRQVHAAEGCEGVLNYLANAQQLGGWPDIAKAAHAFVTSAIKADASMELVWEQLGPDEVDKVASLAATVLLRDSFSEE
jgi:hypothetical protein